MFYKDRKEIYSHVAQFRVVVRVQLSALKLNDQDTSALSVYVATVALNEKFIYPLAKAYRRAIALELGRDGGNKNIEISGEQ